MTGWNYGRTVRNLSPGWWKFATWHSQSKFVVHSLSPALLVLWGQSTTVAHSNNLWKRARKNGERVGACFPSYHLSSSLSSVGERVGACFPPYHLSSSLPPMMHDLPMHANRPIPDKDLGGVEHLPRRRIACRGMRRLRRGKEARLRQAKAAAWIKKCITLGDLWCGRCILERFGTSVVGEWGDEGIFWGGGIWKRLETWCFFKHHEGGRGVGGGTEVLIAVAAELVAWWWNREGVDGGEEEEAEMRLIGCRGWRDILGAVNVVTC
jgi:hypothetical protein